MAALTRDSAACAACSRGRVSTRRCWRWIGRWRRCWRRWPQRGIQGGLDLSEYYPELGPALLVCATETKTSADIEAYARALSEVLRAARAA